MKDLVDILLIAERVHVDASALRAAITATFAAQNENELPRSLPDPPSSWTTTFRRMSGDVGLTIGDLASGIAAARQFLHPVPDGQPRGAWQPDAGIWG